MFKVIVSEGETRFGPDWTWIDTQTRFALDKIASVGTSIPPSLAAKIDELQGTLPHNKVAFYNRALGSFESFGINRNGDGFARHELRRRHDTFVKNAHYYKHHVNKDPALSRGRPVASAFNDDTDMVDLIIVADREKCEDQIQALENGRRVPTSMGAKVAHDVCTICDHQAKNRREYCEHVKQAAMDPYGMGKVLPDGRVCGVMNPNPNFFDISDVIIGAAPESETLMKVASGGLVIPSAELAEMLGLAKWAEDKESAHFKEIPGEVTGYTARDKTVMRGLGARSSSEPSIPDHVIDKAVAEGGFDGLLRNSAALGIVLKPEEFSRAAKIGSFNAPTWDEVRQSEPMPKSILKRALNEKVISILSPFFDLRSSHQPALVNRIADLEVSKEASISSSDYEDTNARKMYSAYRRSLINEIGSVGGVEGEYFVMKCAGTSERHFSDVSRGYVASAFLPVPDHGLEEKVLDRVQKFANHPLVDQSLGLGQISSSVADELGIETMDLLTLQSLQQKARH